MTRKQKAVVIEEYIKLYSERSDNWIAEDLGVDNETVEKTRTELENKGALAVSANAKTKDGRTYPRKRPKPKAEPEPVAKRQGLEEAGQLPETGSLQGKDGKAYPRKQKPPRLLPALAPIREHDALTLDALTTRYRCRCGNTAETGIRLNEIVCVRCGSATKAVNI